MFNSIGYTCRLHACDMFDKILVMASRGLIKVLFNLLLLHHCFPIILLLLIYHSILGNDSGFGPEKVAQIPGTLAQNWKNESLDPGRQPRESSSRFLDVVVPTA